MVEYRDIDDDRDMRIASRPGPNRESLLVREVDGELLILDRASDRIHQLNATAKLIWDLHSRGRDEKEIGRILVDRYEIDEHSAYRDVVDILGSLRRLGLKSDRQ